MPIQGQCPGCGRKFQAPDKLAGKRVKCPNCSALIDLGGSDPPRSVPPREAAQGPPPLPPRPCGEEARWFAKTADGRQLGPMNKAALDSLVAEGTLDGCCQVRQEDWRQFKWAEAVYPQLVPSVEPQGHAEPRGPWAGTEADGTAADAQSRIRPCPDCGETVSRRAGQCPHCGCPLSASDDEPVAPADAGPLAGEGFAGDGLRPAAVGKVGSKAGLLVAGVIGCVLLVFAVVVLLVWQLVIKPFQADQAAVKSAIDGLTVQTRPIEMPPAPPAPAETPPTPEEIQQWMEEAAAAAAKEVDSSYRLLHQASAGMKQFEQSLDFQRDPLGKPGDQLTPPAEVEPYESQYEALYEECITELRKEISAGKVDRARVWDSARHWAEGKQAAWGEQLPGQLLEGLGF
jgi:hypothetical protein